MINFKTITFTAALVAAQSGQAGDLYTPSLTPGPGEALICTLLNVTGSAHQVSIITLDPLGQVVTDTGDFTLPPEHRNTSGPVTGGATSCKFVVDVTPPKGFRGAGNVINQSTGESRVVVPAQ